MTPILSSCASFCRRPQPRFWKKISSSPTAEQNEGARSSYLCRSADGPYAGAQIGTPGGFCSCRHISGSRSNQGGDRQTPQLRRRSNSGSESTSPARAESNPRQGGGSLGAQEYACRCLLALWLWLWQVIANRLCLVSTDTYGGCWHVDRWVPHWPPGLPLMASTRMNGLIFKVLLVASHSHRDAFTDSSTGADHVLEDNLFVHQTQKSWWWLSTIT